MLSKLSTNRTRSPAKNEEREENLFCFVLSYFLSLKAVLKVLGLQSTSWTQCRTVPLHKRDTELQLQSLEGEAEPLVREHAPG